MTVWKRWSWPYRVLALLGLALLLQGSACYNDFTPRYEVPGVGTVLGQKLIDANGRPYYWLIQRLPSGTMTYIQISPATPLQYAAIERYFYDNPNLNVIDFDRPAIPGGASTPAAPPGM